MISVALATYNGGSYVEPFLASVQAQDWPNVRLVVSDDGSTDGTPDRIAALWADAAIHRNTATRGVIGNFSNAMMQAGGSYVALADQDDIWEPHKLSTLMRRMQACEASHPGVPVMVFSDLKVVDSNLRVLQDSFFASTNKDIRAARLADYLVSNHVPGCTMLVNDALLQRALPIPPGVMMHDWWLALVAATFGVVDHVEAQLVQYRQHGANTLGAPTATASLAKWRNRVEAPLHRIHDYRRAALDTRRTLSLFRDRFAEVMSAEARTTFATMLDRGPIARLRLLRGAHTGENRIKSVFQISLM
jgi:glycosyltransferase involved in cell wall biosynthesis